MLTHLDVRLRGAAALLLVGVYLVPPVLGVVAELSHVAYHVHEALEPQRSEAAAYGFAHLDESSHGLRLEADDHHEFVHTHGGLTHHHSEDVDVLLAALGHAHAEIESPASTSMDISAHLPAIGPTEPQIGTIRPLARGWSALANARSGRRPPIPPPRIRALA